MSKSKNQSILNHLNMSTVNSIFHFNREWNVAAVFLAPVTVCPTFISQKRKHEKKKKKLTKCHNLITVETRLGMNSRKVKHSLNNCKNINHAGKYPGTTMKIRNPFFGIVCNGFFNSQHFSLKRISSWHLSTEILEVHLNPLWLLACFNQASLFLLCLLCLTHTHPHTCTQAVCNSLVCTYQYAWPWTHKKNSSFT